MFQVIAPNGETVYKHYDRIECEHWIADSGNPATTYIVQFIPPANGIAGMAYTD